MVLMLILIFTSHLALQEIQKILAKKIDEAHFHSTETSF